MAAVSLRSDYSRHVCAPYLGVSSQMERTMDVTDIKAFIPSKDYETSKSFYSEIGFDSEYVTDELTLFQNGDCLFFLQRFYDESLASNFMLQICVSDIDETFRVCSESKLKQKSHCNIPRIMG